MKVIGNFDADNDGICDELEMEDVLYQACNYSDLATDDNGSCFYPSETYLDQSEIVEIDSDEDSVCDEIEVIGCTNLDALISDENFWQLIVMKTLCTYPDETYLNCEGDCLNDSDGEKDGDSCHTNPGQTATMMKTLQLIVMKIVYFYPDEIYLNCEGDCLNDSDGDGVCDEIEIEGWYKS